MRTRVVVPLLPPTMAAGEVQRLNPRLVVEGESLVLMPQLLATLALSELGERLGSLAGERDTIVRAVDTLVAGV